jgi:transposase
MDKHSYNIIKIKAKNGTTYAYEDYSYWDKERGYSTHKRRSIGKVLDDGSIAYNKYYLSREESKDVVADVAGESALASSSAVETSEHDSPPVSYTIRVGQKLILDKVCAGTEVRRSLLDAFPVEDTDSILALAYYTVCRGKAFCHSEDWLEARGYADLGLTSQRISELLASISDDKQNTFFKSWMERQGRGDSMLFDITSISTYGKGNPYAERGYNRDREDLEQINLGLLTSVSTGLPMWFAMTPGSMSDKAVLEYVLKMLSKLGAKKFTFFGDRGFYSEYNLRLITKRGHRFTIPVPSTVGWQKQMIAEHKASLLSPRNVIELEDGQLIYGKTVYRMTEYGRTWYHIFFDAARKSKVIDDFMRRLRRCKDELEDGRLAEGNKSMYETYFRVTETPKRGRIVEYNDQAVNDFIENDSCYWVLMSTSEKDTRKALLSYRERNDVEVSFDDVKNAEDMRRMRNHNERTIKGKLFVVFIALILLTKLRMEVQKVAPKDRHYWSERDFLEKVDTYTRVHFENKYRDVYTTPTAAQRDIFNFFNLEYGYKGRIVNTKEAKNRDEDKQECQTRPNTQE